MNMPPGIGLLTFAMSFVLCSLSEAWLAAAVTANEGCVGSEGVSVSEQARLSAQRPSTTFHLFALMDFLQFVCESTVRKGYTCIIRIVYGRTNCLYVMLPMRWPWERWRQPGGVDLPLASGISSTELYAWVG